jgi:hypothetical protein
LTEPTTPTLDRHALLDQIRHSLARLTSLRHDAMQSSQRSRQRTALRAWQSARLARTHADLLGDPRYGAAARFFLSDLYGPADTRERDEQMEHAIPRLAPVLPAGALKSLALAVELDALTEELDHRVVDAMQRGSGTPEIDAQRYAAAYRAAGTREERRTQVELVDGIGRLLDRVSHKPMIQIALELSRGPARLAGLGAVQDFLERGLAAFRGMQGAGDFLETIRQRETSIMERLFAGDSTPFDLPQPAGRFDLKQPAQRRREGY